jgi:hypothetical protein
LPPTLTLNAVSSIEFKEGSVATRGGQFETARGGQAIVVTASSGVVSRTRQARPAAWTWSLPAVDGPSGPVAVTIKATDPVGVCFEVPSTILS